MSQSISEHTGRTPPMFASLLVVAVMIGLIVLSVALFGTGVSEGPLQVSMTLATLFALGVAYIYGYRGAIISDAIREGINGTVGTIFVLLAIGSIIGTLYLSGTVAAFIYYGVDLLNPQFYYVIVFLIATVLAYLLGSSLTTIGAVGVAFVGLASIMGVSPIIAAGAAISGAILGDKTSKISDTFVLTVASVGSVTADEHSKVVIQTAIPTFLISAGLYLLLGLSNQAGVVADASLVKETISEYFNISLVAFIPVVLIFMLSALKFSAYLCLMLSAMVAVVLAAFTQQDLIVALSQNPDLSYFGSVFQVGMDTLSNGFHLNSGVPELDSLFAGGGTAGMLSTIWLILVAASFGAVADYTGMLRRVISPIVSWTTGASSLMISTMLTAIGLNAVAADPYLPMVLVPRMFREEYIKNRLKPVTLSVAIADSGTIFSGLIPWGVMGALFAGTIGIGTLEYAPYTFVAYLTPLITIIIAVLYFRKDKLPEDEDAETVYGDMPTELPSPEMTA